MAELKKSGTAAVATSQVDPVKTNTLERLAEEHKSVVPQDVQKHLSPRDFAAFVMQRDLRHGMSSWLAAHPDKREITSELLGRSHKFWVQRELEAFKDQTPAAIKKAKRELTVEAFGARILTRKYGASVVGWLGLSPEERKSARENFEQNRKDWINKELRQHTAGAGKQPEAGLTESLSKSTAKKSAPTRAAAERKWDRSRPKQGSSDSAKSNTQNKSRSSAKGAAASDKDSSPSR